MGPPELEQAARALATRHGASINVIIGDDLLKQNFPLVHAVGRAADRAPRLIDITWGDPSHPKITLVGKGVCFDTGGLDIKSDSGMLNMKKDMGGAATGAVILSRTRGLDIKILGTQGYDAGLGILAPANGPIKTPKDLAGKTIGVTAAGGDTPFLPAYCKAAGIDYASLDIVSLDSQIIEASVINGRVDAMVAFAMSSIPNFVTQNFPVTLLRFSDYGIDFYWVNTLARQGFIEKNPQLVRDVQAGMMDGLKWTMLNPEEAVERHLKEQQELAISKNAKLFTELGVGMLSSINIVPETEQNGLGYSDLDKIDQQAKQVVLYTGKPDDPPPPPAKDYVINLSDAMPKLTADEWRTVRERSKSYAQMLGRA